MRYVLYGTDDAVISGFLQNGRALSALTTVCLGRPLPGEVEPSLLAELQLAGLVSSDLRPGPVLMMPPDSIHQRLSALADGVAERYAHLLSAGQSALERAYLAGVAAVDQGIPWDAAAGIVLLGLTLDLGVGQVLVQEGLVSPNPTGARVLWAFREAAGTSFGVRTRYRSDLAVGVGELWMGSSEVRLRLTAGEAEILRRLRPGAEQVAGGQGAEEPGALLGLRFARVVAGQGDGLRLAVPVIQAEEPLLSEAVPAVAGRLAREALLPAMAALPEWQGASLDYYRLTLQRLSMERAAARLLAAGAARAGGGLWCWYGSQPWEQVG